MFEKPGTERLEEEEGLERIERFVGSITSRYRSENIPVSDDGRIDMLAYTSLYPEAAEEFANTREGKINAEELHQQRLQSTGEKLEILAYALFAKNLGQQFVIARSAPLDDMRGVDTILFDRETGNLVCAFDEVGDTDGEAYRKKLDVVKKKNEAGGASLKYGLKMQLEAGNKKIVKAPARNLPLFYLAVPKDRVEKGIRDFLPEGQQSEIEERLFAYFVATLTSQVTKLELYPSRLNPDLQAKLTAFKKVLSDLSLKQTKRG